MIRPGYPKEKIAYKFWRLLLALIFLGAGVLLKGKGNIHFAVFVILALLVVVMPIFTNASEK